MRSRRLGFLGDPEVHNRLDKVSHSDRGEARARRPAKITTCRRIYGHVRALTIDMKELGSNPLNERSSSAHDQGSTPFSLETVTEHRLFKTTVWSQVRDARLLVLLSVPLIYACSGMPIAQ